MEYYHQDHLGSTRLKTDAEGDVSYGLNYEPFGPGYGESGSEEFRYTRKREDGTDLYLLLRSKVLPRGDGTVHQKKPRERETQ